MEYEGSLPYPQQPATYPYPEPHQSTAVQQAFIYGVHILSRCHTDT
jgi:hypothetical protein